MRVLIVGSSDLLDASARTIAARGHEVARAPGIDGASVSPFQAALVDEAREPDAEGACRALRALQPSAFVVAILAAPDPPRVEALLAAGATDFFYAGAGPVALASRVELYGRALLAEASLEQSHELLRTMTEGVPALVSYVDRDERIHYVNRTYKDWYGKAAGELVGKRMPDALPPDRYARRREATLRVLAGEVHRFEEQLVRPDGRPLWMRVTLTPDRDANGEVRGLISLAEDITELKVAQLELREQRERLEVTLRSIGDAVIATDAELRVAQINPTAEVITGFSRAEAIGRPLADVFRVANEDTGARLPSLAETVLARDAALGSPENVAVARRDGTLVPIVDVGAPIRDDEGRVHGVVLVFKDASAQRAAERALRESEERYRLLFLTQPIPMLVHDDRGTILDANPALEAFSGYGREELVGRPLFDFAAPRDAPRLTSELGAHTSENEYRLAAVGRKKGGAEVPLEVRAFRIRYGAADAVLAFLEDQTERERALERLGHAQKMEAIGRLSGGIAHDFNNMLAPILMNADLLRVTLAPDEDASALDEIKLAASRAAALARQLLSFSRKQVLTTAVLDPNAIVTDVERLLRRILGEDVRLVCQLGEGVGAVRADRSQIEQILVNLAANARDAMPAGGELVLRTSAAIVDDESAQRRGIRPGAYVSLVVRDNGVGMDAATRARAFEPFFTTKPLGQGTGLGLATVYDIVRRLGGDVTVDSEAGRGAEVHVLLPRVDEEARAPTRTPSTGELARGHETILVVEDEPSVRRAVSVSLRRLGYTVLEADSGERALEVGAAYDGRIHLVVSDVVMPGLRGPELLARLRATRPTIATLLMSGFVGEDGGVEESGTPFLAKPFTPVDLAAKVREVLDTPR